MKITKQRLKEIIKEELKALQEVDPTRIISRGELRRRAEDPAVEDFFGVEDDPLITRRGDEEAAEPSPDPAPSSRQLKPDVYGIGAGYDVLHRAAMGGEKRGSSVAGAQQPIDAPPEEQTHEWTLEDFEEFMRREES